MRTQDQNTEKNVEEKQNYYEVKKEQTKKKDMRGVQKSNFL
jgi:hypothetical protein